MRLLAMEGNRVPLDALCAQHHAERQSQRFEHRPLLDMQFQICRGILLLLPGFRKTVDFDAAAP